MNEQSLVYAPDILGMTTQRRGAARFSSRELQAESVAPNAFGPALGWRIVDANLLCDIVARDARGHPRYLDSSSAVIDYSRFNYEMLVSPAEFMLRGGIPRQYSALILGMCLVFIVVLAAAARRIGKHRLRNLSRLAAAVAVVIGLLSVEVIVLGIYAEHLTRTSLVTIEMSFSILWWLLGAVAVILVLENLVWRPLATYTGRPVPQAVRFFFRAVILFVAFLCVTAFVFDQQVTSVLATSGVLTVIVGLAIQSNIANAFAGLVLNIERPFRIGDWVKIGDSEGQIIEFTWRSTRLRTWDGNAISIPNNVVIEATSTNYGSADDTYTETFSINIDVRYPPVKVERIVCDAILSTPGIHTGDGAIIGCQFTEITDWSATYSVVYSFRDYGHKRAHRQTVIRQVWDALNRAGITPATRKQEVRMLRGQETAVEEATRPFLALSRLDLFASFDEHELIQLVERAEKKSFGKGDIVARPADSLASVFVILDGEAKVTGAAEDGGPPSEVVLKAGDCVGEFSALTGEPLSDTIAAQSALSVLAVSRDELAEVVRRRPEIADSMGGVLAKRAATPTGGQDEREQMDRAKIFAEKARCVLLQAGAPGK